MSGSCLGRQGGGTVRADADRASEAGVGKSGTGRADCKAGRLRQQRRGFYRSAKGRQWRIGTDAECLWRSGRSEEHTSELQSLMRISYAVFCLKKKKKEHKNHTHQQE